MRNIPRYGATRTFLDVYDSATGLILYSHALEGEDQFPWNALLTRDGRFTILVVNRRLTGDDQYEVLVYETLTAVHLYSLPDPFITFDFSGEFAYRSEWLLDQHQQPVGATLILDALSGEVLDRVIDGGELYQQGHTPISTEVYQEPEPEDWFSDRIPLCGQSERGPLIVPGEGLRGAGMSCSLGDSPLRVMSALGQPELTLKSDEIATWRYYSKGLMLVFSGSHLAYLSLFGGVPRPFDFSRYRKFEGATAEGICLGMEVEEVLDLCGTPEKDIEMHFAGMPYRWLDYSTSRGVEYSFIPRTGQLFKIDLSRPTKLMI